MAVHSNRMQAPPESPKHSLKERAKEITHRGRDVTVRNPGVSAAVALGAGIGLGLLLGAVLGGSNRRNRKQAEGVGRRMLDSLRNTVPDSWTS